MLRNVMECYRNVEECDNVVGAGRMLYLKLFIILTLKTHAYRFF
jgi:hypothetical protein